MIIKREYYLRGKRQDSMTKYINTEIPDKEFDSQLEAESIMKTEKINID